MCGTDPSAASGARAELRLEHVASTEISGHSGQQGVHCTFSHRGGKAPSVAVVDNLTRFTEVGVGFAGSGGFVPHRFGEDDPPVGP